MNLITYISSIEQLEKCCEAGLKQIILEHKAVSRFGKLGTEEFITIANRAQELNIEIALEWDVLMTESEFGSKSDIVLKLNDYFQSIRVQDAGAIYFAVTKLDKKIQLILESANHNLKAVEHWVSFAGDKLERIILSIELEKSVLEEYCKKLKHPIEFLGLGRILLFYTPRNLLSTLLPEDDEKRSKSMSSNHFLEATGESEESPHKGFPLIENGHGTFMFHIKRLFLLEHLSEMKDFGVDTVRVDMRFDDNFDIKTISELSTSTEKAKSFKTEYPYDVIKGYFNINKTDVLFKKLKNNRVQRKDKSYIGEVIEIVKSEYMAIMIKKNSISVDDEVLFITPEGREMSCKVFFLRNSNNEDVESASKDQLCLINYFSGVWPKSQVYLNSILEK
jgi:putative protease